MKQLTFNFTQLFTQALGGHWVATIILGPASGDTVNTKYWHLTHKAWETCQMSKFKLKTLEELRKLDAEVYDQTGRIKWE